MRLLTRFAAIITFSIAALFFAGGCCCGKSRRDTSGKNAVSAQKRRTSEFDFYCAMRPQSRRDEAAGKTPVAFTTVVFDAMKAKGYKVYLVHYESRAGASRVPRVKPAGYGFRDFFGGVALVDSAPFPLAYQSGYGMRDFFGDKMQSGAGQLPPGENAPRDTAHAHRSHDGAQRPTATHPGFAPAWNREVVLWETRRGEFFLVDGPYAQPVWVEGRSWIERVRFCDPAALAVARVRS